MHRRKIEDANAEIEFIDKIVAAESFRSEILRLGHEIPLAGHMGEEHTEDRTGVHLFWEKFHEDISKCCATCPGCQLVA